VAWTGRDLADILSVQEERVVGNDNTVRYERRVLQIPADRHRHHYVKSRSGSMNIPMAVFHGPRCLARYQADGALADASGLAA